MDKAKVYIKENKERFISELLDLLRIPSISAQSERKPDMLLPREECPRIQQIAKKKRYYLDENGKPVYDEAGNIVIVDTDEKGKAKKDENGEQATNAIALDYLLVSGKNAYCRYFTFTQPSGYDMSAVGTAITLTKGNETIDIIYDTEKSVDDKSADIGEVITSLKAQGFNPEVNDETKTLCGEDAKFTEIKVSANGKEAFMVSALFEKNGVTYACTYKTSKAGANTGDFESIVNSISFR